jgi:hypothetical protein
LPRETESSDGPSSLPAPELNPLLNPLLGQNMGRWAEVYFKSPPEKREQAVLELLRELRAENPGTEGAMPSGPSTGSEQSFRQLSAISLQVSDAPQPTITCRACGRENPASHRFCGMCGQSLLEEAALAANPPVADFGADEVPLADRHRSAGEGAGVRAAQLQTGGFHVSDLHISDQHIEDQPIAGNGRSLGQIAALPPVAEEQFAHPREDDYEPVLNTGELSLFQHRGQSGYSDGQAEDMFLDPPARRPYRIYIGIALAVAIFGLGYMAWQSTQATSQNSRVEPQSPPVLATQPEEETPGANALKAETSDRSASASPPATTRSNANPISQSTATQTKSGQSNPAQTSANQRGDRLASDDRANSDADKPNDPDLSARSAKRSTPTTTQKTPAEAATGYGDEELATAQRYLDGSEGQPRNPAEAAQWLWKAMAKHNAKAPLLLADLYLKGEGVSKNCDQARVLLDSATRAGVKDAAERLRHLQAFGCQ